MSSYEGRSAVPCKSNGNDVNNFINNSDNNHGTYRLPPPPSPHILARRTGRTGRGRSSGLAVPPPPLEFGFPGVAGGRRVAGWWQPLPHGAARCS